MVLLDVFRYIYRMKMKGYKGYNLKKSWRLVILISQIGKLRTNKIKITHIVAELVLEFRSGVGLLPLF